MWPWKKTSPRRSRVRKNIIADRDWQIKWLGNTDSLKSALLWVLFVVLCICVLSFKLGAETSYLDLLPIAIVVILISLAAAFYIRHYQKRLIRNHARAFALLGLFILLLATARLGTLLTKQNSWATATAVAAAIILTVAYDQRFAIGMSIFYCLFACFAVEARNDIGLFLTMLTAVFTCCLSLKEIRTRRKMLEVSVLAAALVFIISATLDFWAIQRLQVPGLGWLEQTPNAGEIFSQAGWHAGATVAAGVVIHSLLPLIESIFLIATSMTLLDYSDANQMLLKRLAMEAPGTFSHSLLVGSIAEAAAEAIERNGLLCRVGAYYHDIGKINKAGYFVENEMGSTSRHKELSPAMSQLIIAGHVKDGVEMAKEFSLPAVLRQFIETHHGTTLIEYFYDKAKKKHSNTNKLKKTSEDRPESVSAPNTHDVPAEDISQKNRKSEPAEKEQSPPSEAEFRYPGPKPRTKEAAIVMLADIVEGAIRALPEVTPTKIEAVVHNMAMKRLQDGQFDMCDLSLRELSQIEASMSKALAAHYHGRIKYPKQPDTQEKTAGTEN